MNNKISNLIMSFLNWYIAAMTKALYPNNCCEDSCYSKKPKGYYITHK